MGTFSPFYRNHNAFTPLISQGLYRWTAVAESAKKVIDVRCWAVGLYFTVFSRQSFDGKPLVNPMFSAYPDDKVTAGLELQYFYRPSLLVARVTEENATSAHV